MRVLEVVDVDVLDLAVVDGELLVVDVEGVQATTRRPRRRPEVSASRHHLTLDLGRRRIILFDK